FRIRSRRRSAKRRISGCGSIAGGRRGRRAKRAYMAELLPILRNAGAIHALRCQARTRGRCSLAHHPKKRQLRSRSSGLKDGWRVFKRTAFEDVAEDAAED